MGCAGARSSRRWQGRVGAPADPVQFVMEIAGETGVLGRDLHTSPLELSLVPHCQRACGSGEVDPQSGCLLGAGVWKSRLPGPKAPCAVARTAVR